MMNQMNINKLYYINLDFRKDRRKFMENQIKSIPTLKNMERYDAIDGQKINYEKENLLCELFEVRRSGFKLGQSMTKGAYGLCKTLLEIYKKNVINKYGNILICEDDCMFVDNFDNKFIEHMNHLPKNWDMIHFGYLKEDLVIKKKVNDYYSTYEYKPGNQCFMINQNACEIFLKHLKDPILPSDTDMVERVTRKGLINAYITNERLGYQKKDDISNTIPRGDKNFYYDKKNK